MPKYQRRDSANIRRRMNMDENEQGVIEQDFAEPVEQEETTDTTDTTETEETEAVTEEEPKQSQEDNAKFANMRRETDSYRKQAQEADELMSQMYGESHNIHSVREYKAAMEKQSQAEEAERQNVNPDFYSKVNNMQSELNAMRQEKALSAQDTQLSNDPKNGELYKEWRDEIHGIASEHNVDYDIAFTYLVRERISDLMSKSSQKAEQKTLSNVINRGKKQVETGGEGGTSGKIDVNSLTDKQMEDIEERAMRGEKITFS